MIKPHFLQNRRERWKFGLRDFLHRSIAKILLFLLLILSSFSYALSNANGYAKEYEVKAAFLYKLKNFITWPKQSSDKPPYFFICILGQDPFNEKIDLVVKGESLIKILRINEIKQAENCQVLFISGSEELRLNSIFKWLEHRAILSVSDIQDFANHVGMVEFYQEEDRIRLAINLQNINEANLKASAHLLRISKITSSNTRKGNTNG